MVTVTTIKERMKWRDTYATKQLLGIYCVPDAPPDSPIMQLVLKHTSINGPLEQGFRAIGSLRRAYVVLFYAAGAAVALSIAYIFILSRQARCLIYTTLFTAILACAAGSLFFLVTAYRADKTELLTHNVTSITKAAHVAGTFFDKQHYANPLFSVMSHSAGIQVSYGIGFILLFGWLSMFCVLCCCAHKLNVAAALVDCAADCMLAMWSLVLEAVIDMIFRLALLFLLAYGLFWVVSCGTVHADNGASFGGHRVTGMSRSLTFTREQKYMIAYYVFGSLWIMELANALGQFVISYMVVLWYYTPKVRNFKVAPTMPLPRAYFAAFFCHLGSLAIGSFTIACVRVFQIVLGGLSAQSKASGNKVTECVAKGLGCILECFQNCMEFLNKNAYIDVAINSNNFCVAAKNSCEFMMKNATEIIVNNGACLIFQVIGVLTVMGLTGAGTYMGVTRVPQYMSEDSPSYVSTPALVAAAAGCVGGLIAMVFMLVFDQTADTLLYTYTWNKNTSKHGAASANQYAPSALMDLERQHRSGYTALHTH